MNPPRPFPNPHPGLNQKKAALLKLLTDEDPSIVETVRNQILSYGEEAISWLRPYAFSEDSVLRRRVKGIIRILQRQAADIRFLSFCLTHGRTMSLEDGIWALSQTRYPEISPLGYSALLDQFAADIRNALPSDRCGPEPVLATINEYLFGKLKLRGDSKNYYDPANSYLTQVLDRRKGNPISLSVIYLLVARRLQLPVIGIGMPAHFLCRYQSSSGVYYVDAFHKGKLLTKADCVKFLMHNGYGFKEEYLDPVTSSQIIYRVCSNLQQIYQKTAQVDEAVRLERYLIAISKNRKP